MAHDGARSVARRAARVEADADERGEGAQLELGAQRRVDCVARQVDHARTQPREQPRRVIDDARIAPCGETLLSWHRVARLPGKGAEARRHVQAGHQRTPLRRRQSAAALAVIAVTAAALLPPRSPSSPSHSAGSSSSSLFRSASDGSGLTPIAMSTASDGGGVLVMAVTGCSSGWHEAKTERKTRDGRE